MHQNPITIDSVDRTGALRDAAERVDGSTRAAFLAKGVLAAGATATGGGLLAAAASGATGLSRNDRDILNFALLLEYLESSFYADAIARNILTGGALKFAQTAGAHEANHVKTLRKVLGSSATSQPTFDFSGTNTSLNDFYATSIQLEETGVAAYKGQAPRIDSTPILQSALLIHSVEARHAAWVRKLALKKPVIHPLDPPLTKAQVLARVKATGFVKSP